MSLNAALSRCLIHKNFLDSVGLQTVYSIYSIYVASEGILPGFCLSVSIMQTNCDPFIKSVSCNGTT